MASPGIIIIIIISYCSLFSSSYEHKFDNEDSSFYNISIIRNKRMLAQVLAINKQGIYSSVVYIIAYGVVLSSGSS